MRTDATEWHWVMEKELGDLKRMGVYEDIDALLEGKKAIGCRWVYEFKIDESGGLPIYKTHLAAQGFSQVPFMDYGATFVPVERCDVSLTGETTNTKHTHKWSGARLNDQATRSTQN